MPAASLKSGERVRLMAKGQAVGERFQPDGGHSREEYALKDAVDPGLGDGEEVGEPATKGVRCVKRARSVSVVNEEEQEVIGDASTLEAERAQQFGGRV